MLSYLRKEGGKKKITHKWFALEPIVSKDKIRWLYMTSYLRNKG